MAQEDRARFGTGPRCARVAEKHPAQSLRLTRDAGRSAVQGNTPACRSGRKESPERWSRAAECVPLAQRPSAVCPRARVGRLQAAKFRSLSVSLNTKKRLEWMKPGRQCYAGQHLTTTTDLKRTGFSLSGFGKDTE